MTAAVVAKRTGLTARKAKGDGHLRRGEILAAAERIFFRDGYEGATIRKIADEVGVSSTALYMHFRDKTQILVEICRDAFDRLTQQNGDIAGLDRDPVARIRLMLEAYIRFGLANPSVYHLVLCASSESLSPEIRIELTQLGGRPFAIFTAVVGEAVRAGRLAAGEPLVPAQVLWAGAHGLVSLLITHPRFTWAPIDDLTRGLLNAMLDGVLRG